MPSAEYQREWRERNPGKGAEYSRKWYAIHKEEYGLTRHRKHKTPEQLEKLRTQGQIQNEKHKESRRASSRKWGAANKGRVKERNRLYYLKTRDKRLRDAKARSANRTDEEKKENADKMRIWRKTETGRLSCLVSKMKRRSAEGSFTPEDIKDLYATQGGSCYYCSVDIEGGYHIEHMTPLSRGGRNDVSNICLACAPCNLRKHTKTAEEFQNG